MNIRLWSDSVLSAALSSLRLISHFRHMYDSSALSTRELSRCLQGAHMAGDTGLKTKTIDYDMGYGLGLIKGGRMGIGTKSVS